MSFWISHLVSEPYHAPWRWQSNILADQDKCDARALHGVSKDGTPDVLDMESNCKDKGEERQKPRKKQKHKQRKLKDNFLKIKDLLVRIGAFELSELESEIERSSLNLKSQMTQK